MRKVGITLRSSDARDYDEPRDALARDWYRFLTATKGQFQWLLLPNLGPDTLEYALSHGVDALLLTGGDDLGSYAERDSTEQHLLAHASSAGWPVLGVCRGMQSLNAFLGGQLVAAGTEHHACVHPLELVFPLPWAPSAQPCQVNSFHRQGIATVADGLRPIAWHKGICEAFIHQTLPWVGVMWHPERESPPTPQDKQLFAYLFGV